MSRKRLGRELLGVKPRTIDVKNVPGFDPEDFITIRELTAREVKNITSTRGTGKREPTYLSALYIVSSVVDEDGNLIFTEDDIPTLQERLGYKMTTYLVEEILRFNDLLEEDITSENPNAKG